MDSPERPDVLLDDTLQEILDQFDCDHVFPVTYVKEDKDDKSAPGGFWSRVKAFFGFGTRVDSPDSGEPGAKRGGGEEPGVPEGAGVGSRPSAAELAVRAKP